MSDTPINIAHLERELHNCPNKTLVNHLISGLTVGFHTGIELLPQVPLECKNLLSARTQPTVVDNLIQYEIDKGYLEGPYVDPPYSVYRISPIGVAQGKFSLKNRLIVDLSAPHNSEHHSSINSLIHKDDFSLQYVRIDDAINIIKSLGTGAQMCKTDIVDAFKLIPIHSNCKPFYGIKWRDQYYFYKRLVFGSRSSPKIFDCLKPFVGLLKRIMAFSTYYIF